jgi:hypothetical protein
LTACGKRPVPVPVSVATLAIATSHACIRECYRVVDETSLSLLCRLMKSSAIGKTTYGPIAFTLVERQIEDTEQ